MSNETGKVSAARLLALQSAERPDAVFSTNDAMALGFMDGLRQSGVRIPEQLSLIGFDNLPASAWTPYQLTTFEHPLDAMVSGVLAEIEAHQQRKIGGGTTSARLPSAQIAGDGVIYCEPRLVDRSTTMARP